VQLERVVIESAHRDPAADLVGSPLGVARLLPEQTGQDEIANAPRRLAADLREASDGSIDPLEVANDPDVAEASLEGLA
jgi:hypothetical protein